MIIIDIVSIAFQFILHWLNPVLVPICFVIAWGFTIALVWSLTSTLRDVVKRGKTMHEIPCTRCRVFTNDYRLKCTIQPSISNTENAIYCLDFQSSKN